MPTEIFLANMTWEEARIERKNPGSLSSLWALQKNMDIRSR